MLSLDVAFDSSYVDAVLWVTKNDDGWPFAHSASPGTVAMEAGGIWGSLLSRLSLEVQLVPPIARTLLPTLARAPTGFGLTITRSSAAESPLAQPSRMLPNRTTGWEPVCQLSNSGLRIGRLGSRASMERLGLQSVLRLNSLGDSRPTNMSPFILRFPACWGNPNWGSFLFLPDSLTTWSSGSGGWDMLGCRRVGCVGGGAVLPAGAGGSKTTVASEELSETLKERVSKPCGSGGSCMSLRLVSGVP